MIVDVAIMAALSDEYTALQNMLTRLAVKETSAHQGRFAKHAIITLHNGLRVVLSQPTAMGQLNAAVATGRLLHDLNPRIVLLAGIAGCMEHSGGQFKLGDIAISDKIIDYELEKVREKEVEWRPGDIQACRELVTLITTEIENWPTGFDEELPPRPFNDGKIPRAHIGNVFSGNQVLASSTAKGDFLSKRKNAIAIEMEAAGIAAMLGGMRFPEQLLMVKAFSDWADGTKNDDWRSYACKISATFVGFLLREIIPLHLHIEERKEDQARDDQELFQQRVSYAFSSYLGSRVAPIPFLGNMADALCKQVISETCQLASLGLGGHAHYAAEIGTGYQFLLRARPLFSSASCIYATSVDSVSTFWLDPLNRKTACEYIKTHGQSHGDSASIMRLFVFTTPESAHNHARVLDYHAQRFENTFVCSHQEYRRYLDQIAPGTQEKYLARDFAILECPTQGGAGLFFADLDARGLSLHPAKLDQIAEVDCVATKKLFQRLSSIHPGVFDSEMKVLKWEVRHWMNHKEWSDNLTNMFEEPTADVFHIVTFDVSPEKYAELRTVLADIKYQIFDGAKPGRTTLAARYGVKDVWLAKLQPHDRKIIMDEITTGALWYSDNGAAMNYILIMRFQDGEKLAGFMRDPEHLKMRLKIFSQFDGPVKNLMREFAVVAPADLQKLSPVRSKVIYESLESLAASNMRRYDYSEDELISEMVHVSPPAFP